MKTIAQKSQTQLWNHLDKAQIMAKGTVDWDTQKIDKINKLFDNVCKQLETLVKEKA